jgi:hypothetical protein
MCHTLGVTNCVSRTTLYATLCVSQTRCHELHVTYNTLWDSMCHRLGVTNCVSRTTLYATPCVSQMCVTYKTLWEIQWDCVWQTDCHTATRLCVTDSVIYESPLRVSYREFIIGLFCKRALSYTRLYETLYQTVCDRQTVIRQHHTSMRHSMGWLRQVGSLKS